MTRKLSLWQHMLELHAWYLLLEETESEYVDRLRRVKTKPIIDSVAGIYGNSLYEFWHYGYVIMGAIVFQISSLTIVYSTVIQTQIKENIKAPRHRPLRGEFTGDRWIPRINGQ